LRKIAAGEGGVWHNCAQRVVRIDPQTNQVAATIPLDHTVIDVAVGEGAVWILGIKHAFQVEVLCVDPHTNQVAATIPVGTARSSICVRGRGSWFVTWATRWRSGCGSASPSKPLGAW
jgi:hypothetical protein